MREPVTVEAYAGRRRAEKPLRFTWRDSQYEILEIERQWVEEDGSGRYRVFEVLAAPRNKSAEVGPFVLSYDDQADQWFIGR